MMISTAQLQLAQEKLQNLDQALELFMDPGADPQDPLSRVLQQVIAQLVHIAPGKLSSRQGEAVYYTGRPSITIRNIQYLAVPLGHELEPFLDALIDLSGDSAPGVSQEALTMQELSPALVEVLIAPTCPNCPKVVTACSRVATRMPQIHLVVIDVQYFADLAGGCKSVPTVIIDHQRTAVGELNSEEFFRMLQERDDPSHLSKSILSMIEAGRLTDAVPLLLSEEGIALLALLLRASGMQQRMGMMLLVERALDENKHCLDGAVPHLLPLLKDTDATLRGDTADILGKIGAPGAREDLSKLLVDENEDVRDVASEALSMLRQPS